MIAALLLLAVIPDPTLTPGATDPMVTQSDVATTICQHGYTLRVRHVTQATKRAVALAYRAKYPDWPPGPYEIDHLVSIELGGSNEIANLWPQPLAEARRKDVWENRYRRAVCKGEMTLAEAQSKILDWRPEPLHIWEFTP